MKHNHTGINKYIKYYAYFCIALYSILSVVFLNTNYVEGDDASTVLYHLMGRDKSVQMPYSAYHSGFDFLLTFFPANEIILRNFAVITSFITGGLILFLVGLVLFRLNIANSKTLFYYLILLPFIIPEFIFNCALYNPTNVGFAFILLSILPLLNYIETNQYRHLIWYALLFAVAIPFRWSLVFVLPVYLALYLLKTNYKPEIKKLFTFFGFSLIGIGLAFIAIAITGYTPKDMLETYLWGTGYMDKAETSILSLAANAVSYYSLPFILCLILGSYTIIIKSKTLDNRFWLLLLLSITPYFIVTFHTNFKYSITYMPMLLLLGSIGFETIFSTKYLKYTLFISIAMIWFVGIQFDSRKLAYGPGFQNKITSFSTNELSGNNPDKRVKNGKIKPSFCGGLLMPTAEGPRPLMGYFYVIFGGEWKNYIAEQEKDRVDCIKIVQENKAVLFQDRRTAYLQCDLYKLGYQASAYQSNGQYSFRTYINKTINDTIVLNVIPDGIDKAEWIIEQQKKINQPLVLRSSYSNLISDIASKYNNNQLINTYTILLR